LTQDGTRHTTSKVHNKSQERSHWKGSRPSEGKCLVKEDRNESKEPFRHGKKGLNDATWMKGVYRGGGAVPSNPPTNQSREDQILSCVSEVWEGSRQQSVSNRQLSHGMKSTGYEVRSGPMDWEDEGREAKRRKMLRGGDLGRKNLCRAKKSQPKKQRTGGGNSVGLCETARPAERKLCNAKKAISINIL